MAVEKIKIDLREHIDDGVADADNVESGTGHERSGNSPRLLAGAGPLRKRLRACAGGVMVARMLRFMAPILALALAACASAAGPAPVSASHRPQAAQRVRADPTAALLRAGAADAINIAEARSMFGAPDVERRDGAGVLMVWTLPSCALTLGFVGERLQSVTPGPRRTDDPAPALQTCIAEARARAPQS